MHSTTILNWNVAWARPEAPRGIEILRRIRASRPEVICLSEASRDFLPRDGHLITSSADYGYRAPKARRKVVLWSSDPWVQVDDLGSTALPSGRFVSGVTCTGAGLLRFIGVCVPWRDAHVRTGRRDRAPWADHLAYLQGLVDILAATSLQNSVLLGDFNRTFPTSGAPAEASALLTRIDTLGLRFITSGLRGDGNRPAIDHIAVGSGVTASTVSVISNRAEPKRLSDHFGLAAALAPSARPPLGAIAR